MIRKKTLSAKFITAVFVLLLAGQTVGAVLYLLSTRSALFDSLQARMKRAASVAAGASSSAMLNFDYAAIEVYLDEITRDDEISSIHVLDEGGKVLREKIRADDADLTSMNPLLFRKAMELRVPVVAAGKRIGEVQIHYNARTINETLQRHMIMVGLYQALLLMLVAILLMLLFGRYIKQPLSTIGRTLDKITLGDLTAEVPDVGDNEIGEIAKGIAFLKNKLTESITRINSTGVNVTMAVKQLELTYQTVLDGGMQQAGAIKDLLRAVQTVSRSQSEIGDGTTKLNSFSAENVSSLLEMKAAAEEIASHTQRLFKATEDSYSVAVQLSHSSKEISESATQASAGLDDTSASVEEIEASIKEVAEHARESSQLAEQVKEATSSGGMMSVVNASEGMENIAAQVKKSAEIIEQLGTRSADIEKVLSVIKDVTEQTNLLSLNAAILAAQAGEYGKSFSVVADEISALSERTASSTREISSIVKTIQRDIKEAVYSINSTKAKVEEGNSLVIKVGEALRDILNASYHSSDMTKAIERATDEQSLGLRQITAAIDNIRKTMFTVVKATTEQHKAIAYLLDGIGDVKEVAELTKRGALEQAEGIKLMSKNIELASERINQINQLNQTQKKLNNEMNASIEQIDAAGLATARDMEKVTSSLQALAREIDALKLEMEAFRVG
ncbi:MAG: hypothetical protein OHK006_23560 [Thermodesulfovibrionales bacterium]